MARTSPSVPARSASSKVETTSSSSSTSASRPSSRGPLTRLLQRRTSQVDSLFMRLNKLLSTTSGLDTSLATLNYALYLIAYLQTHAASLNENSNFISRLILRFPPFGHAEKPGNPNTPPPVLNSYLLASLITEFRTTLRLTYLIPLLAQLRILLFNQGSPHPDRHNYSLALFTTVAYILYQLTENLAHLADHRLFLGSLTTVIPQRHIVTAHPGTSDLWFLSNRLWHAGVTLDLIRAARAVYFTHRGPLTSTASSSANQRFVADLLIATCWWPLTLHWSLRSGLKGVDDFAIGILGTLANWVVLRAQWAATREGEKGEDQGKVKEE